MEKLALVTFRVVASTGRRSCATVRISRGSRDHVEAEAEGNGPMDAVFASTLSTTTVWSGRHESQLTLRVESTGDEAPARTRSRRRHTPTCARSQPTYLMRFQEHDWLSTSRDRRRP